jgi:hypothetical protein
MSQTIPNKFPRVKTCAKHTGVQPMFDAIFLAIGFGFLALTVLYAVACDRL